MVADIGKIMVADIALQLDIILNNLIILGEIHSLTILEEI
jgi:hypothetical protein